MQVVPRRRQLGSHKDVKDRSAIAVQINCFKYNEDMMTLPNSVRCQDVQVLYNMLRLYCRNIAETTITGTRILTYRVLLYNRSLCLGDAIFIEQISRLHQTGHLIPQIKTDTQKKVVFVILIFIRGSRGKKRTSRLLHINKKWLQCPLPPLLKYIIYSIETVQPFSLCLCQLNGTDLKIIQ